jgi:UPF0271 protein
MLLNCDLGEDIGEGSSGADAAVMPYIHQASIACGFHAGGPLTMRRTLALAARHGVEVGAHPAYPDLEGFGRRSMSLGPEEIGALIHYQAAALEGMARSAGLPLAYVKPHGVLYHDMMGDAEVRRAILEALAAYHSPLKLVVQATAKAEALQSEADACNVPLLFEAFADRRYGDDGKLLSRSEPGAVLEYDEMLAQVEQLLGDGTVTSIGGVSLALRVDTLCVHGDNPEAVRAVKAIRALVDAG